jgi:large subunit ribosomal protein L3
MKFILATKIGMTQRFKEDGRVAPVTVVLAGPCFITQVKTKAKDGYDAVQLGFQKARKLSQSQQGHLKGLTQLRFLKEIKIDKPATVKRGDKITVENFQVGDKLSVTGRSKGKGFQGVVRRHGFAGSPATHGHKDQLRMPGSIGATAPQRVLKGRRMAGHMGDQRVTTDNLEVMEIDKDNNLMYIKGALPGARRGLLMIRTAGEMTAAPSEEKPSSTTPEKKDNEQPKPKESKEVGKSK